MEKGEYKKAVTRFERVLQIDPKYDMAVLNLGIIHDEHLADKEQAARICRMMCEAGLDVYRLAAHADDLEKIFLQMVKR